MRLRTAGSTNAGWIRLQMDIASEQQGIERFLRVLLMATVAILALALIGGWIVTTRALASIGGMTATALGISADNLSERIDAESAPAELEGLARTLNDSFERLEGAFDRQARFTADASHELRTPLAIIHAHLELALSKGQDPDKLRGRVEASFAAAKRMRAVVERLLTLAWADAKNVEFDRSELALAPLVEDVVGSCATLAAEAGVGMRVRTQPVQVEGDDARLRELITNLCVSAIRHNFDGGTVEVTLESAGAQTVLRVSDTGPGIAPGDHERIFERFYRVDKARSRAEGGSGLGLAIARWIAEMHQGQISVESALGKGATFIVEIPFVRSLEVEGRRENPDLEYRR